MKYSNHLALCFSSILAVAVMLHAAPTNAKKKVDTKFQRTDANNDGKITRAESRADFNKRFDQVDTDRDGKITKIEKQSALDKKQNKKPAKKNSKKPAKKNSKKPAKKNSKKPAKKSSAPSPQVNKYFKKNDANGDGVVTRKEAIKREIDRFARIDKNHDGVLTKSEITADKNRKKKTKSKKKAKSSAK